MITLLLAPATAQADISSWSSTQLLETQPPFSSLYNPTALEDVSCTSGSFCVAAGQHFLAATTTNPTGGSAAWQVAPTEATAITGFLGGASCASSSLCVAVDTGGKVLASTTPTSDSAWTQVATAPSGARGRVVACPSTSLCVVVDSSGDVLTASNPTSSGSWTTTNIATGLAAISCPTSTLCVAVGGDSAYYSTNPGGGASSWQSTTIDAGHKLQSVSCTTGSFCVAVDDAGNVLETATPTGSWTQEHVDGTTELNAISCPSTGLCVATDVAGNVLSTTDPSSGTATWSAANITSPAEPAGVWCTSASSCVVVDSNGDALTSTNPTGGASAWSKANIAGQTPLDQGACPAATLCVLPDRLGKVFTTSNPTGGPGAWSPVQVDGTHQLFDVACPTTTLCVAVDDGGDVVTSTDPADGASASWSVAHIDGAVSMHAVACPSAQLCVAGDDAGRILVSTNPAGGAAAWSSATLVDSGQSVFRMSCPSTTLCVAGDEGGGVVTSTNPIAQVSAWTRADVDGTTPLFSVSCPSEQLCLAGDKSGNVVSSTNPAGGAAAWQTAAVSDGALFGLTCPSTTLCVSADNAGEIRTSTDPTGGASSWPIASSISHEQYLGVACASTTLCVVSDFYGGIVVGSGSAGPVVQTQAATGVTGAGATLNGTVNPKGSNVTDCHFDYGTSTSYGSSAPCVETVGGGTSDVAVHADISGLAPNTPYHFRLQATNAGGAVNGGDATFTTSGVAPTVAVSDATDISTDGATLHGTVNPENSTVTDCHFDYGTSPTFGSSVPCAETVGGGGSDVSVSAALTGLDLNTPYYFQLVATNGTGTNSASGTFTTAVVDTTITSGPTGPTNNPSPTFTFTANPDASGTTFLCSLDHAVPSPCTSPVATGPLADGGHSFTVRAKTPSGDIDQTPAVANFQVDTKPPVTAVTFAPEPSTDSARVGSGDSFTGPVQITASVSDPDSGTGVVEVRCVLDPRSAPKSFSDLPTGCVTQAQGVGSHVVYAASRDAAGNLETPTAHSFKILATPDTTITSGLEGPTWSAGGTFTFSSTVPGSTFRCKVDGGPFTAFTACSSPFLSGTLSSGDHTFQVEAISPDGLADPTPASRSFTVNAPQSHHAACHIQPFLSIKAYDFSDPDSCGFAEGGGGPCNAENLCVPVPFDEHCPAGALCTLTVHATLDNADQNAAWGVDANPDVLGGSIFPPSSYTGSGCAGPTTLSTAHCSETTVMTLVGQNDPLGAYCDAADRNGPKAFYNLPGATNYGPGANRSLDCTVDLTIAPGPPLTTIAQGLGVQVLVPSAGSLALSAPGFRAGDRTASAAARHKPPFATIRVSVRQAGVITLHLRLSRAAARAYKRHKRLTIRVLESFTPAGGTTITRTITLKLLARPLTLRQRCEANKHVRKKVCRALLRHRRHK